MAETSTDAKNVHDSNSGFNEIGESLRSAFSGLGKVLAIAGIGITAFGCSPKTKSSWSGTFTDLPAPPAESRMVINVSTESDGEVFINYIIWDSTSQEFLRRDVHYLSTNKIGWQTGSFREAGGYQQKIHDGEVLAGGARVDQGKKVIVLLNGDKIDGPTGNVVGPDGTIRQTFGGNK